MGGVFEKRDYCIYNIVYYTRSDGSAPGVVGRLELLAPVTMCSPEAAPSSKVGPSGVALPPGTISSSRLAPETASVYLHICSNNVLPVLLPLAKPVSDLHWQFH